MTSNIQTLLHRGVDTVLPSVDELAGVLDDAAKKGKRLRVYLGIDPTSPHLHIGHTIPMRKLAHFQQAGHQAILLIGDFTARLGDPDKLSIREPLTKEQVKQNMATYMDQAKSILEFEGPNPVEVRYNSEWSDPMTYEEIIKLAAHFTVQQMLERDMFQRRMEEQRPISLSEFFYPLMQGYDAVALEADIQIGGTDQTFNMLAGRTLNRVIRNTDMYVVATPLLADKNGTKIGKTQGNAINIDNPASELYGQIMSLPDEIIVPGLQLLTDMPNEIITGVEQQLDSGQNPMELKKQLAHILVEQYHGLSKAREAAEHFSRTVQSGETPEDIETVRVSRAKWNTIDLIMESGMADSKSKARTLLQQGAVEMDGKRVINHEVVVKNGTILKVGKRQFKQIEYNQD